MPKDRHFSELVKKFIDKNLSSKGKKGGREDKEEKVIRQKVVHGGRKSQKKYRRDGDSAYRKCWKRKDRTQEIQLRTFEEMGDQGIYSAQTDKLQPQRGKKKKH